MDKECSLEDGIGSGTDAQEVPDLVRLYSLALLQPPEADQALSDLGAERSLDRIMEALVFAFITTNLKFKGMPLKSFLADFERSVIQAALRLTHGNQKDAASLLSLKPTALFEKMRKHGIRGKQIKFTRKIWAAPGARPENSAAV